MYIITICKSCICIGISILWWNFCNHITLLKFLNNAWKIGKFFFDSNDRTTDVNVDWILWFSIDSQRLHNYGTHFQSLAANTNRVGSIWFSHSVFHSLWLLIELNWTDRNNRCVYIFMHLAARSLKLTNSWCYISRNLLIFTTTHFMSHICFQLTFHSEVFFFGNSEREKNRYTLSVLFCCCGKFIAMISLYDLEYTLSFSFYSFATPTEYHFAWLTTSWESALSVCEWEKKDTMCEFNIKLCS